VELNLPALLSLKTERFISKMDYRGVDNAAIKPDNTQNGQVFLDLC